jgi:thioredoxin 1
MRGRKWLVLVVVLAVAAVLVARGAVKGRQAETPAARQESALPGSRLDDCLRSGRPTLADFGKGWCVPCRMMEPVLKRAGQNYRGKANIVFVDMEEYGNLARQYRIAAMPTQIFFDAQGKEVTRHLGYMGTEDIERELAALGVKK